MKEYQGEEEKRGKKRYDALQRVRAELKQSENDAGIAWRSVQKWELWKMKLRKQKNVLQEEDE